ncbi:MAG: hypothetical protein RRA32_09205 [bacterium]|nr:hypothetical protein [bacterium]
MKRYVIMGSVAALVLVSVSVFALQSKSGQDTVARAGVAREVAPKAAGPSSGCGTDGSGCGSSAGCGGCGGLDANPREGKARLEKIEGYLVKYYTEKLGISDITIEIESFGCHEEATVKAEGKVIEKLTINGNSITKIES